MAKYLLLYAGGKMPETEDEQAEVMKAWEDVDLTGQPSSVKDYAEIWRAADKVVYSTTLGSGSTARTRIERTFEPVAVREMKAMADRDISVGGPGLAAEAIRAGGSRTP